MARGVSPEDQDTGLAIRYLQESTEVANRDELYDMVVELLFAGEVRFDLARRLRLGDLPIRLGNFNQRTIYILGKYGNLNCSD